MKICLVSLVIREMKIMNTESPFYSYYSGKNLEAWQIWAWMERSANSDTSLLGVEATTVILEKHLAQACKVEQIHTPQVSNSPLGHTPENLLCRCIKRHTNVLSGFVQKNRRTKQPKNPNKSQKQLLSTEGMDT